MKTAITLGLLLGIITSVYVIRPDDELTRAELQLEATAGAKLKDTWPEFRDSLCKGMTGDELEDCRIYQTRLFEAQIRLYKEDRKAEPPGA